MRFLIALSLMVVAPLSAHAQIAAPSVWVNNKGSVLTIDSYDPSTSKLVGSFTNNAPGFDCQGQTYEVAGAAKGNQINFYVNFKAVAAPDCKTITIWNGLIAGNKIGTKWKLYYVGKGWKFYKLTGADIFTKK